MAILFPLSKSHWTITTALVNILLIVLMQFVFHDGHEKKIKCLTACRHSFVNDCVWFCFIISIIISVSEIIIRKKSMLSTFAMRE